MNLICGINPVLEALQAGTRHFDRLVVVKGLRNQRISEAVARATKLGVPLRFEGRDTLDRMAGGVPHQGLIAVVSAKPTIDLDALLAQARDPALIVALDGLEDPRNLGAIVRSCEAAGADGVLLPERHSVGLTETVSRASAGALEHLKVARVGNLAQAVATLKERGVWVIGFDASGKERWDAVDYKRPVALVFGGEGRGIRRLVRERCDHVVSIPLFGQVASLNVSVAAGVGLFEVIRQRGVVPSHVRPIPPRAAPPPRRIEGPPPDDAEHDPGAPPRIAGVEADGGDPDDGEPAHPINLIRHFDEDIAWGRSLSSPTGPEARESERQRRPQVEERAASQPGRPGGQGEGSQGRGGRRRRRRRGHGQAGPRREDARPQGGEAPPAASTPHEAARAGQFAGRRRRGWRRRQGPGPPR